MIDWERYFTETIRLFREEFKTAFSGGEQEYIRQNLLAETLLEPCQIEFFALGEMREVVLVFHETNLADMFFRIHTAARRSDIEKFIKERENVLPEYTNKHITEGARTANAFTVISGETTTFFPKTPSPADLADAFVSQVMQYLKDEQVKNIEKTTEELKKSIPKIPEKDRDEFFEYTTKIDTALREIARMDSEMKEEIGGVRKIIGASKEFQDFRVFTTEVEDLKKTHIPKDVFVSEVKRLDEKIDKGLEGLSTRIEDIKAIKFWSKRTLLDIALAILAVLATLYGAGILKL